MPQYADVCSSTVVQDVSRGSIGGIQREASRRQCDEPEDIVVLWQVCRRCHGTCYGILGSRGISQARAAGCLGTSQDSRVGSGRREVPWVLRDVMVCRMTSRDVAGHR